MESAVLKGSFFIQTKPFPAPLSSLISTRLENITTPRESTNSNTIFDKFFSQSVDITESIG